MDIKEQVKIWVENKFEKIINSDLKNKIVEENSDFDLEDYVNNLFGNYLSKNDVENLRKNLKTDFCYNLSDFESENSSEELSNLNDSLELGSNECRQFSTEDLIKNLDSRSEEIIKKSLQDLEASTEDLMNQSSWSKIADSLRAILKKRRSREIQILVLKVFWKLLNWHKRPQVTSKGFDCVAKLILDLIDIFNLENRNTGLEEIYDIKEEKWLSKTKVEDLESLKYGTQRGRRIVNPEVLIKLMWLLIDYQHQIRVNETKYREIIFSFIQLLSSTTTSGNSKLSGLELLSILSPKASWCHSWCHTAVGRSLLCSALRKHRNFFVQIIETILNHVKIKKSSAASYRDLNSEQKFENDTLTVMDQLKINTFKDNDSKQVKTTSKIKYPSSRNDTNARSAPIEHERIDYISWKRTNNPIKTTKWIIECIPRRIVEEAVFFHCVSFLTCLIKYRSGRALFPVQTAKRKRLVTVQDLSLIVREYLENSNYYNCDSSGFTTTSTYQMKALEMLEVLKTVSTNIHSSRMSAKRPQFSCF